MLFIASKRTKSIVICHIAYFGYIVPLLLHLYLPLNQSFSHLLHLAASLAAILDLYIWDGLRSFQCT